MDLKTKIDLILKILNVSQLYTLMRLYFIQATGYSPTVNR